MARARAAARARRAGDDEAWKAWYALENSQLNWTRNGLSASGIGVALVQLRWRREQDDTPPIGGSLLALSGVGATLMGSGLHIYGAIAQRSRLRLTPGGWLVVFSHAAVPPLVWGSALACVVDNHPKWLCEILHAVPKEYRPLVLRESIDHLPHAPPAAKEDDEVLKRALGRIWW